jgi:hypothetical protein
MHSGRAAASGSPVLEPGGGRRDRVHGAWGADGGPVGPDYAIASAIDDPPVRRSAHVRLRGARTCPEHVAETRMELGQSTQLRRIDLQHRRRDRRARVARERATDLLVGSNAPGGDGIVARDRATNGRCTRRAAPLLGGPGRPRDPVRPVVAVGRRANDLDADRARGGVAGSHDEVVRDVRGGAVAHRAGGVGAPGFSNITAIAPTYSASPASISAMPTRYAFVFLSR